MKEPSGKLNTAFRVLMRPLSFDIEIDASGKILSPDRDIRIFMPYSEDDRPDGEPAPHGSVIQKKVKGEIHFIIDWKFDWISRHSPKSRPLQKSRVRADGDDQVDTLVLHITSGPRVESAIQKFLSPNKRSGIHYIVDLDGHVVKLMEERFATFHAGFKDNRDKDKDKTGRVIGATKLRENGWRLQSYSSKWGIKDCGKSSSVFKQSIGIEHQIGLKTPFPKGMIAGCVRLVEQIVNHFGIEPWNVIGHADVIALKGKNRLPKGGGRWAVEEFTKACPGLDFPWKALQDFETKDGTRRPLSLGPAHGMAEEPKATIYGGVFQHLAFIDDAPPNDTVKSIQTQAIEAMQKDLRRMGFWCPGWKSTPRKRVTDSETYGELNFGVYDNATHGAVRLFQRRCMIPRGDKVSKQGRADLITAQRIRKTVASPGLPPLELPLSTPP
jgi:N-acetyl-anhydromuramyl-L-alanine amidase AmpD